MDSATLKVDLLRQLYPYGTRGQFCFTAGEWAMQFCIPVNSLADFLDTCVDEGLITACSFDGQKMKHRAEWNDRKAFFANTNDHGFIRVGITAAGSEYIERLRAAGKVWGNRTCMAKRQ